MPPHTLSTVILDQISAIRILTPNQSIINTIRYSWSQQHLRNDPTVSFAFDYPEWRRSSQDDGPAAADQRAVGQRLRVVQAQKNLGQGIVHKRFHDGGRH